MQMMVQDRYEYHRPDDIDEAASLLRRKRVRTVPIAGGTTFHPENGRDVDAVVNLADLHLDFIDWSEDTLHIGAMTSFQSIIDQLPDAASGTLAETASYVDSPEILKNATLGGLIGSADIHAPFSVMMAALKARVKIYEMAGESPYWSEMSKEVRIKNGLPGRLLTVISMHIPDSSLGAAFTQSDPDANGRPIVSAAAAAYREEDEAFTYIALGGILLDLVIVGKSVALNNPKQGIDDIIDALVNLRVHESNYINDEAGSMFYRTAAAPELAHNALIEAFQRVGITVK